MWIYSTLGHLSVVSEDDDTLIVRTRDLDSVEGLVDGVCLFLDDEDPRPFVNEQDLEQRATDYPYRVRVPREAFCQWIAHDIREYLTYGSFKTALKEARGDDWYSMAHYVWVETLPITEPGQEDFGVGYPLTYGKARAS